jgi:flagellar hook-basal body complex protein FliE
MSIESIAATGALESMLEVAPLESTSAAATTAPSGQTFESLLSGLQNLNTQMIHNQESVSQLALGQSDNLHQVMMASEQTRLDFELLLAVRNKLLEAYQDLMRMQA